VKQVPPTVRLVASGLAAAIGCKHESVYMERPWTDEEEADFADFCDRIGETPSDPELALAMESGECDFFNNDVFVGVKLYRA
jgi:hypothetical protein